MEIQSPMNEDGDIDDALPYTEPVPWAHQSWNHGRKAFIDNEYHR